MHHRLVNARVLCETFRMDVVSGIAVDVKSRVVPGASGGFVVSGASSGTLLHELGLQNGDKIISINGYPPQQLGRTRFGPGT